MVPEMFSGVPGMRRGSLGGFGRCWRRLWSSLGDPWGCIWGPGLLERGPGGSLGALWRPGGGPWGAPGGAWGSLFVSGSLWERFPGNSGRFREPFWLLFGMILDEFS